MPSLKLVHPWPANAYPDRLADDDEITDVAIRGCRSVAELYSEALTTLKLPNRLTELRVFTTHSPELECVLGTVHVDPTHEGFEMAGIAVPTSFLDRVAEARARMLLDAVHGIVVRLAEARGWDATALETCRRHVLDHDLEYRWTSPAKSSPDRRLEARAEFRMLPDGYGRVRLRVSRRDDGSTVAESDEGLAFCTSSGFRRTAKTLRWRGKDEVDLVPYVPFSIFGSSGALRLSRVDGTWHSDVETGHRVREMPEGEEDLAPLPVRVEARGVTAEEQPASFSVGGGPMQTEEISRFHEALQDALRMLGSPTGKAWWTGHGVIEISIVVDYEPVRRGVRARRTGRRLGVAVDLPESSLPPDDPGPMAGEVATEVVELVRRRLRLGPPPLP